MKSRSIALPLPGYFALMGLVHRDVFDFVRTNWIGLLSSSAGLAVCAALIVLAGISVEELAQGIPPMTRIGGVLGVVCTVSAGWCAVVCGAAVRYWNDGTQMSYLPLADLRDSGVRAIARRLVDLFVISIVLAIAPGLLVFVSPMLILPGLVVGAVASMLAVVLVSPAVATWTDEKPLNAFETLRGTRGRFWAILNRVTFGSLPATLAAVILIHVMLWIGFAVPIAAPLILVMEIALVFVTVVATVSSAYVIGKALFPKPAEIRP